MSAETPHILPGGERIWVIDPTSAAASLPQILGRIRGGEHGPFIIGDAGQPEAVMIPWAAWQQLAVLAAETAGFEYVYDAARDSLTDDEPSVPLEDVWDLNEPVDDSDLPKK
ncbi:hypothetical protein ACIA49_34295 [Kribbella sp. NPDC051587]|uniref:hypothetical protein n=1 Tax=Kribbella sp. NPDC051587 TaxID=3364119 RepID=UPI0037B32E34